MKNKMLGKVLVGIMLLILFLPVALAATKPIAGKLEFSSDIEKLEVKVYVLVNSSLAGEKVCVIQPSINNGGDGSFATNLENLVYNDFNNVKCNSFWKEGDLIWYELNFHGMELRSNYSKIESGTGLQWLSSLKLPAYIPPIPPSGGSGGSGGSSGGGNSGGI
ncbi:MAG: hypothetical protein AABY27_06630, partial [Pseudomonadota bacterium]